MTCQARHIEEFSIVRLPDGRTGYLVKKTSTHKPWVIVEPGRLGVEVNPGDTLEVLRYPAELACEWLESHRAQPWDLGLDPESKEVAQAVRYVAAQMAYLAYQHRQAVEECPVLAANTAEAIRRLHDAAAVLGFAASFEAACSYLDVGLDVRER